MASYTLIIVTNAIIERSSLGNGRRKQKKYWIVFNFWRNLDYVFKTKKTCMQNIQNPGGIIVIIGSFYYQNSTIKFINMFMFGSIS